MKLTPLDIRKQEFTRRLRGYDPEEVQAFLQALSAQWESHLEDIRRQEERVRDLENKLQHYERVEEALQEALQTARESSRQALQAAEQKAQQIRGQAEIDAERIKHDAERDRTRLRQETQSILGRRKEIVARLRAFLLSEMEMLAHFDGDDPVGYIKLMPADRRQLGARGGDDDDDDAFDTPVRVPSLEELEDEARADDDGFDVDDEAGDAGFEPPPAGGEDVPDADADAEDEETMGERLLRLDDEAAPGAATQAPAESEAPAGFWMPGRGLQSPESGGAPPEAAPAPATPGSTDAAESEARASWKQRPFFEAPGAGSPPAESAGQAASDAPEQNSPPAPQAPPTSTAEDEIARIRRILQDLE